MSLRTIGTWALQRAREKSTYAGLAALAVAFGAPAVGVQIDHAGQVILAILGSGMLTATTSPQPNPVTPSA